MSGSTLRRHLSMPGLLSPVRRAFDAVPDPVDPRGLSLSGCQMSGLAVFSLKMPSLLQFDSRIRLGEDPAPRRNVRALFGVGRVPSDTGVRERLDRIGPRELRGAFRAVHASLQRGKALRSFTAPGGRLLLSMDGAECHSSAKTGCARPEPQTGSVRPEMLESGSPGSQIKPRKHTGGGARPSLRTRKAGAAQPAAAAVPGNSGK